MTYTVAGERAFSASAKETLTDTVAKICSTFEGTFVTNKLLSTFTFRCSSHDRHGFAQISLADKRVSDAAVLNLSTFLGVRLLIEAKYLR